MNTLTFMVSGNRMKLVSGYTPVSGEKGYSKLKFIFDEEWAEVESILVSQYFDAEAAPEPIHTTIKDGVAVCDIHEELRNQSGILHIGIIGAIADGSGVTIDTNITHVAVGEGARVKGTESTRLIQDLIEYLASIESNLLTKGNQVGTDNIKDGAVTSGKLAEKAVKTENLDTASVTGGKLADNAVNTGHIVDGAVTGKKIEDMTIGDEKLAETYWMKTDVYSVESYAYLDKTIEQCVGTICKLKFDPKFPRYGLLGDSEYIGIPVGTNVIEGLLLISLSNGKRYKYTSGGYVQELEQVNPGGGGTTTVVDESIVYIPDGFASLDDLCEYSFEEGKLYFFYINNITTTSGVVLSFGHYLGCYGKGALEIFNLNIPASYVIRLDDKYAFSPIYDGAQIESDLRTKLTVKHWTSNESLDITRSTNDCCDCVGVVHDSGDYAYRYESYSTNEHGPQITLPDGKDKPAKHIQYKTYIDGPDANKKYMRVGGNYDVGTGMFDDLFDNGNLIERTENMDVWTNWELIDDASSTIVDLGVINTYDQLRSLDLKVNDSYVFTTGAIIASQIGYGPFLGTYKVYDNNSDGVIDNGNVDRRTLKCIDLTQDVRWSIDLDNETCDRVEDYYAMDYVNEKIGDIDTALDNIIAIQNSYIGGADE